MPLPTADPYLPGHGDRSWSARHYDLSLDYTVDENRLRGEARITGVALSDTSRIVVDLAGLAVAKLTMDGKQPKWAARGDRLVITPRSPLTEGAEFTLVLKYAGVPRPTIATHHGDAGWEELTDGVIVAGQPHGAPTWFPCNDRMDDKAAYRIEVTTQPGYTVVANGDLTARIRRGSGETWVYEQDEPMSPYLATVQIGRYELTALDPGEAGVPITIAAVPGADWRPAFGHQPQIMAAFSRLFGPYPFPTYTVVITDDELEIPLESQSLSTFGRNFLNADWRLNRLVAHELAHQWFGNTVTAASMQDIWLHEGFACYAEWLWSEEAGRETAQAWAERHHQKLSQLPQDLVLGDPGPADMFDDRVYKRGALLLHALRERIGDDVFFELLRAWVRRHRGSCVTTADFVALAEELSGTSLGTLFETWLQERSLPGLR
ncbi:M1 family metallopeptidase [Nocardioides sp. Kera G14]|uniref:M1 family metallopeptidase n=1 Tax=Nocardioides sp. Kera G14 TaxID=2884264 RepID=UPI001D1182C8|nr:M1 family metallopeptidase [Nocardioides sp. Kera G14]UDY24292.1 M1 family metallopeptidase [Nocardioides sp. Kera G14]